jgi:hypothetical protein
MPSKSLFTCNRQNFLPVLQLVIIESSVKVNQHNGSGSMLLDCEKFSVQLPIAAAKIAQPCRSLGGILTKTGGNIAVRAFGSTGCLILGSSSASFDTVEFDLNLLDVVF